VQKRSNLSRRSFHQSVRLEDTVKVTYIDPMGNEKTVDAEVGKNLLDIAHDNNIELEGACGGGKCSFHSRVQWIDYVHAK